VVHWRRADEAAAVQALDHALAAAPGHVQALANGAGALMQLDRLSEAATTLEKASALAPDLADLHTNLAAVRLQMGEAAACQAACATALARDPHRARPLASMAMAADALGDARARGRLADFDRLLGPCHPRLPDGANDRAAFNAALCQAVLGHPTLIADRANKTTRQGLQTDELMVNPAPAIQGLAQMIEAAVADYRARVHDPRSDHPFIGQWPANTRLRLWGTVLQDQGHQDSHHHPDGWLSGVYYAALPPAMGGGGTAGDDPEAAHAGWIEFGQPDPTFPPAGRPALRLVQPQEGLMVLFPSYFWHRTVPFHDDTPRISLAFDIVSAG